MKPSILLMLSPVPALGFAPHTSSFRQPIHTAFRATARSSLNLISEKTEFLGNKAVYDPLGFSNDQVTVVRDSAQDITSRWASTSAVTTSATTTTTPAAATTTAVVTLFGFSHSALAAVPTDWSTMTPQNFQPVCPASDVFYRFLQGTTESVVGKENFVEYGPLIAGGLLRVRLELCVVESFFQEAVGPFIQQNGLSWILPLHETVESFLAGTIFALATTFILVGSTKILTVIITYADVFIGGPARLFGGFAFDRARGKPITLDIGIGPFKTRVIGPPKEQDIPNDNKLDLGSPNPIGLVGAVASGGLKSVGEASKLLREIMEALDLFVGRYLVLIATGYIGIKFLHFKVFPDFPNF